MTTIDEKTKIPLFTAAIVIISMAGGIVWLTNLSNSTNANAAQVDSLKVDLHHLRRDMIKLKIALKIKLDDDDWENR